MNDVERDLLDLVREIGAGFHPDTRGGDYVSLPTPYLAADVDRIVLAAIAAGVDVTAVALDALRDTEVIYGAFVADRHPVGLVTLAELGAEEQVASALWLGAKLTGDDAVTDTTIRYGLDKFGADSGSDEVARVRALLSRA